MGLRSDGTVDCDRCRSQLDGMGALYGLVCTVIPVGASDPEDVIFCYRQGCRDLVLAGRVNFSAAGSCTDCGTAVSRSVSEAMLTVDLIGGEQRQLTFCYANGSSVLILANVAP